MPFEVIGAILLFLVVVFIFGSLWFHIVETVLKWLKSFLHAKKTPVWHPLPPEIDDKYDD